MTLDWNEIKWAMSVCAPENPIAHSPANIQERHHEKAKLRFLIDQIGDRIGDVQFNLLRGEDYQKNAYGPEEASKELCDIIDMTDITPEVLEKTITKLRWYDYRNHLDEEHAGDCTAFPATCMRCWVEDFYDFSTHPSDKATGWKAVQILIQHQRKKETDAVYRAMSNVFEIIETTRSLKVRTEITNLCDEVESLTDENYRDWVLRWRKTYKWLSEVIRAMKGARKEYAYKYREPQQREEKRRVKIGANPNHHPRASYYLYDMKVLANRMMEARVRSKERYKELRKEAA